MTLDLKILVTAAAGMCALSIASGASACSLPQKDLTVGQLRELADEEFSRASVVIDAEVIEPMGVESEGNPGFIPVAYLRVIKTLKGRTEQDVVPVVLLTSCDIGLEIKGEKLRILLTGERIFTADQSMNGGGVRDMNAYFAEVDRLAGEQRPLEFAHFPGELPLPAREPNDR